MSEFVVITGQSGAGRTQVGNSLEDLGWFVIDNLPPAFFGRIVALAQGARGDGAKMAVAVGAGDDYEDLVTAIQRLKDDGVQVSVLFLEAEDAVLVRRYESTKRVHPHGQLGRLDEAIAEERALLEPVRSIADRTIDTSGLSQHDLKARIHAWFSEPTTTSMRTTVMSFGFKHGIPAEADVVIDCRFLPNPYWSHDLRDLDGRDSAVQRFVGSTGELDQLFDRIDPLLEFLVPAYEREGKAYLTIAFGCTGGRHRSVCVAERVAGDLGGRGIGARVFHRDIDRHGS